MALFYLLLTKFTLKDRSELEPHRMHACMVMSGSVTPQSVAHQAPLSVGFPKQEHWSGLPFPSPGDLPDPGARTASPASPVLAGGFFTSTSPGEPKSTEMEF